MFTLSFFFQTHQLDYWNFSCLGVHNGYSCWANKDFIRGRPERLKYIEAKRNHTLVSVP